MQTAGANAGRGCSEVDPFAIEAGVQRSVIESGQTSVDLGFELLFSGVKKFSGAGAFLRGEFGERFTDLGELALAPQGFDANGFDSVAGRGRGELRQRPRVELGNTLLDTNRVAQSDAPCASRNSTMACLPPVSARSIARC